MKHSAEVEDLLQRRPDLREYLEKNPMPPIRRKPKPPAGSKTVVEVSKADPNYTPQNRGRVEVAVRELTGEEIREARAKERERENRPYGAPTLPNGQRDLNEELYRSAVDRTFAPRPMALVVSNYDPIQRFEEGL